MVLLLLAGSLHTYRWWSARDFYDQREASRWESAQNYAQVSAFLSADASLTQDNVKELEYKINQQLVQDSVIDSDGEESEETRGWADCYSAQGTMTLNANGESVDVDAVGTGGDFFLFHPVTMASGTYYNSDSLMQDEILLDEETAWKLFGSNDIVGRIVTVDNIALTITGVYSREEGLVYERAGRPSYMVYVSYKSLLQFGSVGQSTNESDGSETYTSLSEKNWNAKSRSGESEGESKSAGPSALMLTRTSGLHSLRLMAFDGPVEDTTTADSVEAGPGGSSGDSSDDTDSPGGGSGEDSSDSNISGNGSGNAGDAETLPDGAGTTNTTFDDTGEITSYEIVMPNPVEGYAAQVLADILGTSNSVIVDNTNRYRAANFADRLLQFGTWSMRRSSICYPYWENVAISREEIFTLLFAIEMIAIAMALILILLVIIYYFRHKSWTLAGNIRHISDQIYERQSRKRYPDYYEDSLPEKDDE